MLTLLLMAIAVAIAEEDACLTLIPTDLRELVRQRWPELDLPRVDDNLRRDVDAATAGGGHACLGALSGDFNADGRDDLALLLTARVTREVLLLAAARERRGWELRLINIRGAVRPSLSLTTLQPGRFERPKETVPPWPRDLAFVETRAPGVLLRDRGGNGLGIVFHDDMWLSLPQSAPALREPQAPPTLPDPTLEGLGASEPLRVLEGYRRALLASDGDAVVDLVDDATLTYYGQMVRYALTSPRSDLEQLGALDTFIVLRLRHEFRRGQLQALSGRDLLAHAVRKDWISRSLVENLEVGGGAVDASGTRATIGSKQAPQAPLFRFVRQDGKWRLALSASLGPANAFFEAAAADSGLSNEEFALTTIEAISTRRVNRRILDGPID